MVWLVELEKAMVANRIDRISSRIQLYYQYLKASSFTTGIMFLSIFMICQLERTANPPQSINDGPSTTGRAECYDHRYQTPISPASFQKTPKRLPPQHK